MAKHFHIKRFDPRVVWNKLPHHGWKWLWGVFADRAATKPFGSAVKLSQIMVLAKRRHERYARGKARR